MERLSQRHRLAGGPLTHHRPLADDDNVGSPFRISVNVHDRRDRRSFSLLRGKVSSEFFW